MNQSERLSVRVSTEAECLGKTPGYVRYSGYNTPEQEARFLPILGPVWCCGDPLPPHTATSPRKCNAV
jgi:hypothetical protein